MDYNLVLVIVAQLSASWQLFKITPVGGTAALPPFRTKIGKFGYWEVGPVPLRRLE